MLATPEMISLTSQRYRLAQALPKWLKEVPLYQPWASLLPNEFDAIHLVENLEVLPFISKQQIRKNFPHNFLKPEQSLETLIAEELVELEHTSGTSSDRTPLILENGWWTVQEEKALRQNRIASQYLDQYSTTRRVTINSPQCNSDICYHGVPTRHDRTLGGNLSLSISRQPFLWTQANLARMAAEATDWQPLFLDVDPVYGICFALYCEQHQIQLPSLRFIITSYEYPSVLHHRILERVFRVPVFNLYGSTETGHLLMEDEEGQMKPSFETALLEVIEPDAHGIGELVVTTLTNDYMPLVRYRIGDLAEHRCEPYCTHYILHGRAGDAITNGAGQRVTVRQVDECFTGREGLVHYQLRRCPADNFELWYIPASTQSVPLDLESAQTRLTDLLQPRRPIRCQPVDMLLSESSGKFRLLV